MEPAKKKSFNIMNVWREYAAMRRRTLSWLGFGPVADWALAVVISFVAILGALYYGWSLYTMESSKEFVPQPQALQSQGVRRQVETAIRFFDQRNASVAAVVDGGFVSTTSEALPADTGTRNGTSDSGIPSIR
jgi:hypothetical protein